MAYHGISQNHGRGGLFAFFRRFMMQNVNVDFRAGHLQPYRIFGVGAFIHENESQCVTGATNDWTALGSH